MKRALLVLVVSIVVFSAPTLFACEKCVAKGDTDPAGNVHNYPSCYTIASGEYGSCVSGTSSALTAPTTPVTQGVLRVAPSAKSSLHAFLSLHRLLQRLLCPLINVQSKFQDDVRAAVGVEALSCVENFLSRRCFWRRSRAAPDSRAFLQSMTSSPRPHLPIA